METFVVGDVHGDRAALEALLEQLGWTLSRDGRWTAPGSRKLIFVGDIVDRGPDSLGCMACVRGLVEQGDAQWVVGNHEVRLLQLLQWQLGTGPRCPLPPSRLFTRTQLLGLDPEDARDWYGFVNGLPNYVQVVEHDAVVVHAQWSPGFARLDPEVQRRACAFGRVASGEDPLAWTERHRGPLVVWGHRIVTPGEVTRRGRTVNVESGCCEGHCLSALELGSGAVVQVPSTGHWKHWMRPLEPRSQVVFPIDLEAVAGVVAEEQLGSEEDYLVWLRLELESCGAEVPDALARAHRRLYRRGRALGGG